MQHDREELLDLIADAISDSLDADWRTIDGAEYVLRALEEAEIVQTFVPLASRGLKLVEVGDAD